MTMLQREGATRIPSGCAISGFINRSGRRTNGSVIVNSIACMHERSNGLGGDYAGYGIYPEYKDQYALHVFYDSSEARIKAEAFLDRHFDVVNLSRIPVRKNPRITDEPLIWRYFVNPLPTKLQDSQLDELKRLLSENRLSDVLIPPEKVLKDYKCVHISPSASKYAENGNKISLSYIKEKDLNIGEKVTAFYADGLIGIYEVTEGFIKPVTMLI